MPEICILKVYGDYDDPYGDFTQSLVRPTQWGVVSSADLSALREWAQSRRGERIVILERLTDYSGEIKDCVAAAHKFVAEQKSRLAKRLAAVEKRRTTLAARKGRA